MRSDFCFFVFANLKAVIYGVSHTVKNLPRTERVCLGDVDIAYEFRQV